MEKNLSGQESLSLINDMIAQTRGNIQDGAATAMIMAGYWVAATAMANIVLLHTLTNPYESFWVWALMAVYVVINRVSDRKHDREALVRTHIDRIIETVLKAFLYSNIVMLMVIGLACVLTESDQCTVLITPAILCMMGLAQYVTGIAVHFKPFVRSAVLFWAGAVAAVVLLFVVRTFDAQFSVLAVCALFGLAMPGHMLNKKAVGNV